MIVRPQDYLVRLRPRDDTLYSSQGRTVLATDRDGFIRGGADHGLIVHQTRLLSLHRYLINGDEPRPVALSNVEHFEVFDRLAVGESIVIFNDHDPQPLRMQIEQMREGEMGWEYVARGPDTFRVRLTRIAPKAGDAGPVSSGTAESPDTSG